MNSSEKLEQSFYLLCITAAGVCAGWMAAFVVSVILFCWIIWGELR